MRCPSAFLRNRCQESVGHAGDHYVWTDHHHIVTWQDAAADNPTREEPDE